MQIFLNLFQIIHQQELEPGTTTSNEELEDIIKIVKSLEDSGLLLKGVSETIQNEAIEQKGGFVSMLLGNIRCKFIRKYVNR